MRTWTDAKGGKMRAQFVREVDGDVTFLKEGKLVTVPLDQLSDEDQKYIRKAEADKKVEETPLPAGAPRPVDDSPLPLESRPADDAKPSLTKQKVDIEERTWRDLRGRPQTGKFVRMHQGFVVISSGSRALRVPYYNLSQPDRDYLREILTARGELAQLPPEMPIGRLGDLETKEPDAVAQAPSAPSPDPKSAPDPVAAPKVARPSKIEEVPEDRIANRPTPRPGPVKPSELSPAAENPPGGPEHVSHVRPTNQRFRNWNLTRPQPDENGETRPNIRIVPLLIGFPIGLAIGSFIGAFVLRGGAYMVLREHVEFGTAFMTMLVANLINAIGGFLIGFGYGAMTGSAEGAGALSLLMLPVSFLVQSGIISNSLETDYGAACLVSLAMYAIWFVIGILIFVGILVFFAPLAATGLVG